MKTIEITLYKFDELSEEAQKKAIEKKRQLNWEYGDSLMFFEEDCKERLKEIGFINPVVQYSLSSSQGDGLSFSADGYSKLNDIVLGVLGAHHAKIAEFITDNISLRIQGNTGRYCYASRTDIDIELGYYSNNETPLVNDAISAIQERLTDIYIDACKELEKDGYSTIEYEDSDEAIKEMLIANEYDFTEDGERY